MFKDKTDRTITSFYLLVLTILSWLLVAQNKGVKFIKVTKLAGIDLLYTLGDCMR